MAVQKVQKQMSPNKPGSFTVGVVKWRSAAVAQSIRTPPRSEPPIQEMLHLHGSRATGAKSNSLTQFDCTQENCSQDTAQCPRPQQ